MLVAIPAIHAFALGCALLCACQDGGKPGDLECSGSCSGCCGCALCALLAFALFLVLGRGVSPWVLMEWRLPEVAENHFAAL